MFSHTSKTIPDSNFQKVTVRLPASRFKLQPTPESFRSIESQQQNECNVKCQRFGSLELSTPIHTTATPISVEAKTQKNLRGSAQRYISQLNIMDIHLKTIIYKSEYRNQSKTLSNLGKTKSTRSPLAHHLTSTSAHVPFSRARSADLVRLEALHAERPLCTSCD